MSSTQQELKAKTAPQTQGEEFRVFSKKALKEKLKEKPTKEDLLWYNQVRVWAMAGGILSLFFLGLAIFDRKFLFLLPAGPVIGIAGWYTKKLVRKYGKYDNDLF